MRGMVVVSVILFGATSGVRAQCLPFGPPPPIFIQPIPSVISVPATPAPKAPKSAQSAAELPKPKELPNKVASAKQEKAMIREDFLPKNEETVAPALRVHPKSKLNLPPDIGTPTQEGPEPAKNPLPESEWTVQQCPIDPPEGRSIPKDRKVVKVGFFNHSDRELWLEVNGETVGIPARNYLLTKLPPKFTWRYKEGKLNEVTIPNTSEGIDLIFR